MAKGFAGLREAKEDIERRRAGGGGNWENELKVKKDESVVVRFLEEGEEIAWCWVHPVPDSRNPKFNNDVPCFNQEGDDRDSCPGCKEGLRRKVAGFINVIQRDAPLMERNEKGWIPKDAKQIGTEDQLKYWKGGITVFDELDGLDSTYRGLSSRDFKITRKGEGFDTAYRILPADPDGGPKPLSPADVELAKEKFDLAQFTTPPAIENWGKEQPREAKEEDENYVPPSNPFLNQREEE